MIEWHTLDPLQAATSCGWDLALLCANNMDPPSVVMI